ncbi:hypothetical protein IWW38_003335, partial [Coemansia aciculifera]
MLGSIVRLNLARNHLSDLSGLRRMWTLEYLDVSENRLDSWLPVIVLRNLPSLSVLNVRGNPFTVNDSEAHHRPLIFSAFDHRDIALILDGHGPTSQERREMAKIPRVATGHATSTAKAAETPAMKVRRPKVAVIEEAIGDDEDAEFGVAGKSDNPSSPSPRGDHGANLATSPTHSHLSSLEKAPRVLRATELQAVTIASVHRRSNVAYFETPSPAKAAHIISMKPRSRFKRRATASTVNGTKAMATNVPSLQPAYTYSVPSSFSTRPTSPTPSFIAPSVRLGGAAPRDPERYRRRVEMMRAEAGSSWLRAFTELQSQSPTASPDTQTYYQGGAHFEQVSPSRQWPAQSRSDSTSEQSPESSSRVVVHTSSPDKAEAAPDTQLPSFLFPRRRTVARNREIASLPHYSECQKSIATSPQSPDSAALADLVISSKAVDGPIGSSNDDSPLVEVSNGSQSSLLPILDSVSMSLSQVQQQLQDDGASVLADGVAVSRYQFIPAADIPTADVQVVSSGSRVVKRSVLGRRAIYISPTDLIEVVVTMSSDGMATEHNFSQYISAKVPVSSLVRASRLGADDLSPVRIESKCGRFDPATWIEYSSSGGDNSGFVELVNAIQAIVSDNANRGLPEHLYKQAECLRCSWHGYVDHERTFFDAISDDEFSVLPPPAKELQCPNCKRSYLREYYAADEESETAASDIGLATQTANAPIWKKPFVTRRNRFHSSTADQPKSAAAEASERRAQHAQHLEAARSALAADVHKLDGIATFSELPFAQATNAVKLFLQLNVFETESERLVQWVPAGLVRQMLPIAPQGQALARGGSKGASVPAAGLSGQQVTSSKWGLSSLLGGAATTTAAVASTEDEEAEGESMLDANSDEKRRGLAIEVDWRASAALAPNLCEQAVYLALSSQAIYVFSPTWDALRSTMTGNGSDEMDLRPEQYLGLLFSLPLASLGRIDIGPNRQYLALHSALLAISNKSAEGIWDSRQLEQLLATSYPSYPLSGYLDGRAGALQPAQHQSQCSLISEGAASSCVFMIRDRLACSDLLDSLVEIGYETR